MKYLSFFILSSAFVLAGCGKGDGHGQDVDGDGNADAATQTEAGRHDGEIEIHDHQAEELGIKVSEVTETDFSVPVTVSGEVMYNTANSGVISAPMSGRVTFDKGISAGVKVSKGARIGRISTAGMAGGDHLQAAKIEYEAAKK